MKKILFKSNILNERKLQMNTMMKATRSRTKQMKMVQRGQSQMKRKGAKILTNKKSMNKNLLSGKVRCR